MPIGKKTLSITPRKIGIALLLVNFAFFLTKPAILNQLELKVFDFQLQIRNHFFPRPQAKPGQVVILDIDEKALKKFGRYPWSRDTMATILEKAHSFKPKVVALDIIFSEKTTAVRSISQDLLGWIARNRPKPSSQMSSTDRNAINEFVTTLTQQVNQLKQAEGTSQDFAMAAVLAKHENTVLGFLLNQESDNPFAIEARLKSLASQSVCNTLPPTARIFRLANAMTNLDIFSKTPGSQGFINILPDIDGTIRQSALLLRINKLLLPSLALRTLATGLQSEIGCLADGDEVLAINIGNIAIPLGERAQMLVDYRGDMRSFPYLSIADLMDNKISGKDLEGKYVLIGSSAPGLYDLRVTPFSRIIPGVEIHANVIDNILSRHFLQRPLTAAGIEMLLLIFVGLLSIAFLAKLKAVGGATLAGVLGLMVLGGNLASMQQYGQVFFIFSSLLTIVSIYFGMTLVQFLHTEQREDSEKKRREQIKNAFQHYVSATLVEEIIREPQLLKLGGERRELTVLFSDIRGFTTISERLTPEALADLLNEYLTPMTDIILSRRGLLDKYMGDAIMAVFGAPLFFPEHASVACLAAIEMSQQLKILQAHWRERNIPPLFVGVGLNTGEMSVGNMGSKQRFDYTVIGDHVNLGSRLEGTNKFYGTEIIVSEFTRKAAGDGFLFRELDRLQVKGKNQGVTIFELLCTQAEATSFLRELCERFAEALAAYRNGNWDRAQKLFEGILAFHPEDKPSRLFLERVSHFRREPPPSDWVGVYEMKTK